MPRMSWWALLFFAVVAGLSLLSAPENLVGFTSPMWSSTLTALPQLFSLLPSAMAAWAAWQIGRMRATGELLAVRNRAHVLLRWLLPVVVTSVALPLLAVAALAPDRLGRPVPGDLVFIPVASMLLLAWGMVGGVLGRFLPGPVAIPVALVGAFLGMTFPESWSSFAPRHVLGLHSVCCTIDTAVAPAIAPTSLVFYGVTAGLLALVLARPSWVLLGAALLGIGVTFVLGWRQVSDIDNAYGSVPRPTEQLDCRGQRPRLCLWPEQEPERALIRSTAEQITRQMTALRIPVPGEVSPLLDAAWVYYGQADSPPTVIQRSLVSGITYTPMPACAQQGKLWTYPEVMADLHTWVWLRSGFDRTQVQPSKLVADVLQRPLAQQVEWFTRNHEQRHRCDVEPVR